MIRDPKLTEEAADEAGFVFASELVLPHAKDAPAERAEGAGDEAVAGAVGGKLFTPEGGVGFGRRGVERAAVPEAAVDEDGEFEGRKSDENFADRSSLIVVSVVNGRWRRLVSDRSEGYSPRLHGHA